MTTGIVCLRAKTHLRRMVATTEPVLFGQVDEMTHLKSISSPSKHRQSVGAVYAVNTLKNLSGDKAREKLDDSETKGDDTKQRGALLIHLP